MAAERKDALITRIREVFGKREYPGDEFLVVDMSGADWDQIEILAAFRGKRWDEVPAATLDAYSNALSFLTEEAFRFYLPAFMLASIQQPDSPDLVSYSLTPPRIMSRILQSIVDIPDDMLAQLPVDIQEGVRISKKLLQEVMDEAGGAEQVEQRQQSLFESKMAGFTPDEKAVIRDFLAYTRDEGDENAQKALDGYWQAAAQ